MIARFRRTCAKFSLVWWHSSTTEIFKPTFVVDNDDGLELELGDWVEFEGKLIRSTDDRLPPNHGQPILKGMDVIRRILSNQMGVPLRWDKLDNEDGNLVDEAEFQDFVGLGSF